jgi:twitching motility protein PilT
VPRIDELLAKTVSMGGSDLHVCAGTPPRVRSRGALVPLPVPPLDDRTVTELIREVAPPAVWNSFVRSFDADFGYSVPGVARFRANCFRQEYGSGLVMRVIPEKIVPFKELKLPAAVETLAHVREGLVLVTGPTGSGKSTTLAALLDVINHRYNRHVVTIEDPVEFVHKNDKCTFSHREVGRHTRAFGPALKAAIREDADVIMLGEMRDYDSASLTIAAAEMGMLVFATLHTPSAAKSISRLVDMFPSNQQGQARLTIADSLAGVVSQLLVPTSDRRGRRAAVELLLRTPGLPNLVRDDNVGMLYSLMQSGRQQGMQTMDMALQAMVADDVITENEAYLRASDKNLFHFDPAKQALEDAPAPQQDESLEDPNLVLTKAPGGGVIVTARQPGRPGAPRVVPPRRPS